MKKDYNRFQRVLNGISPADFVLVRFKSVPPILETSGLDTLLPTGTVAFTLPFVRGGRGVIAVRVCDHCFSLSSHIVGRRIVGEHPHDAAETGTVTVKSNNAPARKIAVKAGFMDPFLL